MGQNVLAADLVVQGIEPIARLLPSLSRATPSAVSEQFSELIGLPNLQIPHYLLRLS